jgi:hypothetical protein
MGTLWLAARPRNETRVTTGCRRFAVGTPKRGISQRLTPVSTPISIRLATAR